MAFPFSKGKSKSTLGRLHPDLRSLAEPCCGIQPQIVIRAPGHHLMSDFSLSLVSY